LVVASRRRIRLGGVGEVERAVVRRWKCARVGGLKEESRVRRVCGVGDEEGGEGREWRMRKLEGGEEKVVRRDR
jgi:hypothetical protein